MPALKLATFCEKVIIDANSVPSLIGLFSQFKVTVPEGTTFPANAAAPKEWSLFCIWECSPEEAGREFDQVFEVRTPDGSLFSPPQTIKMKPQVDKLRQNVIANAQAIPIGLPGMISVTTRVEQNGKVVVAVMTYSFEVLYVKSN
jgi:hypothetical protein